MDFFRGWEWWVKQLKATVDMFYCRVGALSIVCADVFSFRSWYLNKVKKELQLYECIYMSSCFCIMNCSFSFTFYFCSLLLFQPFQFFCSYLLQKKPHYFPFIQKCFFISHCFINLPSTAVLIVAHNKSLKRHHLFHPICFNHHSFYFT